MRIKIYVVTNSSQEKIEQIETDSVYRVWTHAKAHNNEANKNVIHILCQYLDLRKSEIMLVSGSKSKIKFFEISKAQQ